jgi:hypothetical protein
LVVAEARVVAREGAQVVLGVVAVHALTMP